MRVGKKIGVLLLIALGLAQGLRADERLFGYSYLAEVLPKGEGEFEQWITNLQGHDQGIFSRWQVREEFEAGLTDRLSASLYLNLNSVYESQLDLGTGLVTTTNEFEFDGISTEWKYLVLSPDTDKLGVLLYFEPRYSSTELEFEVKLVLQKNLGEDWVAALNLVGENEYQYTATSQEVVGKGQVTAGLAFRMTPKSSVGLELVNDRVWPDQWGYEAWNTWYLGPSFHYAAPKWWVTFSLLPQVHGSPETIQGDGRYLADDDAARMQTRLIMGVNF